MRSTLVVALLLGLASTAVGVAALVVGDGAEPWPSTARVLSWGLGYGLAPMLWVTSLALVATALQPTRGRWHAAIAILASLSWVLLASAFVGGYMNINDAPPADHPLTQWGRWWLLSVPAVALAGAAAVFVSTRPVFASSASAVALALVLGTFIAVGCAIAFNHAAALGPAVAVVAPLVVLSRRATPEPRPASP